MHRNGSFVKELSIKGLLCLQGSLNVSAQKSDPDMSVRILLDKNSVNFPKIAAHIHNLILDVNKEGRIFSQVNDCRIKHTHK